MDDRKEEQSQGQTDITETEKDDKKRVMEHIAEVMVAINGFVDGWISSQVHGI